MHGFDLLNPPFDRLTHDEAEELKGRLDIGYFRPDEAIVTEGASSDFLHVVIKGAVEARDGSSLLARLRAGDAFDARAVVHDRANEDFVAAEETLCFLVPRDLILSLIHRNEAFAAFFYSELSRKLDALSTAHAVGGMEAVLSTRIRDGHYGPAVFIDGERPLTDAVREMLGAGIDSVFVEDAGRMGIVSALTLSKAAIVGGVPFEAPVRGIAHFDIVDIDENALLVDALLMMTRHNKRRLAIRSKDRYVGFLQEVDLLARLSSTAQLIPGQIARANDLAELSIAAQDVQNNVERLYNQGVRVQTIAQITSDLNRRVYAKLFELVAPPSIRENGCIMLMGSEGRGEQTVRTDQDNGLLLAREVSADDIQTFRAAFSDALEQFGYPPCPGHIMVSNPVWSQSLDGFLAQLRNWVYGADPESAMNLAIFADAVAVAGHSDLLKQAKAAMTEMMRGESVLLARFAHLIETFGIANVGVFDNVLASVGIHKRIDAKRAGIFPIVHAMRTLAIDHGLAATSTAERIEALVDQGVFEDSFGRELISALHIFMGLRLRFQLEAIRRGNTQGESIVDLDTLTAAERDLLRDALRVVRRLRELIRRRYNLGAL